MENRESKINYILRFTFYVLRVGARLIAPLTAPNFQLIAFCLVLLLPLQTRADDNFPLTEKQQIFDFYFLEAVRERLAEDYDCALEMLERAKEIEPNNASVMYELASVYLLKGDQKTAMDYLRQAMEADPDNDWYKLSLAMLYISDNDWKSAGNIYEIILKKNPGNEEIIYYLTQIYSTTGDWQKLIALLNLQQQRYGISEETSLQKFQAYHFLDRNKKANAEIDALIRAFPNEGKYWVMRGKIYDEERNFRKAKEYYDHALRLDPDNAVVYLAYAEHYRALENEKQAIEYIEMAFRNRNIEEEAKIFLLGEFGKKIEQSPQTEATLDRLLTALLETHPESIGMHLLYARYLLSIKRFDEAQAQFRNALKIDAQDTEAWYGLLQLEIIKNDIDALLPLISEALEHLPNDAMFYYYEGIAHTSLNNYQAAINSYERGLAVVDSADVLQKADLYFGTAEIYRMQSRYDEAFVFYEKALEENPYHINTLNNYAYTLAEHNRDLDKAERMSKITLELKPNEASYLDTYGWILYRQGFYNLARSYIEKALKHGADNSQTVLDQYGDVLLKLDEIALAVETWKKAAELEGDRTETIKEKISKHSIE